MDRNRQMSDAGHVLAFGKHVGLDSILRLGMTPC